MNVGAAVLVLPAAPTRIISAFLHPLDKRIGAAVSNLFASTMRIGPPGAAAFSMGCLKSVGSHRTGEVYWLKHGDNTLGKNYGGSILGPRPAYRIFQETKVDLKIPSTASALVATNHAMIYVMDWSWPGGPHVRVLVKPTEAGTEIIFAGGDVRMTIDAKATVFSDQVVVKTGDVVVLDPDHERYAYELDLPDAATVAALKSLVPRAPSDSSDSESLGDSDNTTSSFRREFD
jgi:hypothetical protein